MTDLTSGRRDVLRDIVAPNSVHPGLWMHRYLRRQTWRRAAGPEPTGHVKDDAIAAKEEVVDKISGAKAADGYRAAYRRWKREFETDGLTTLSEEVAGLGRVLLGSGAKGASEFGITLHHTWGVPVLSGSSLKGIAALGADRFFDDEGWRRRADAARPRDGGPTPYDALFGTVEESAAVRFHDAWLVPEGGRSGGLPDNGLHRDVLTVHHPSYYQQGKPVTETDDPIPVSFVTAKGTFLIVLELAPDLDPDLHGGWLEAAWEALRHGLYQHGVGAKTNAGYGRFKLSRYNDLPPVRAARERANDARIHAERLERRASLPPDARVEDIVNDEGAESLQAWLTSGGANAVAGLVWEAEGHLEASVAALAGRPEGLPDCSKLAPAVQERIDHAVKAFEQSLRNEDGTRDLDVEEVNRLIADHKSGKALDLKGLMKSLREMNASAAAFRSVKRRLDALHRKNKITKYNVFMDGKKLEAEAKKRD